MGSGAVLGRAAARKESERRVRDLQSLGAFQATCISVSAGLVYIQETGDDEEPWEQGIRLIESATVQAGDLVAIVPIKGGDYVCLGSVEAPPTFRIGESDTFENNTSSATSSPYSGTSLTDAITVVSDVLPAGTYKVVIRGSLAVSHSSAGSVAIATAANGVDGTTFNASYPTASPATARATANHTFSVVLAIAGTITGALRYAVTSSGTVTARTPEMVMTVKRLS